MRGQRDTARDTALAARRANQYSLSQISRSVPCRAVPWCGVVWCAEPWHAEPWQCRLVPCHATRYRAVRTTDLRPAPFEHPQLHRHPQLELSAGRLRRRHLHRCSRLALAAGGLSAVSGRLVRGLNTTIVDIRSLRPCTWLDAANRPGGSGDRRGHSRPARRDVPPAGVWCVPGWPVTSLRGMSLGMSESMFTRCWSPGTKRDAKQGVSVCEILEPPASVLRSQSEPAGGDGCRVPGSQTCTYFPESQGWIITGISL